MYTWRKTPSKAIRFVKYLSKYIFPVYLIDSSAHIEKKEKNGNVTLTNKSVRCTIAWPPWGRCCIHYLYMCIYIYANALTTITTSVFPSAIHRLRDRRENISNIARSINWWWQHQEYNRISFFLMKDGFVLLHVLSLLSFFFVLFPISYSRIVDE